MALVKCPECGRENVSDTAESCPNCGYAIKIHFDKILQEEEKKKQRELLQKQLEESQKQCEEDISQRAQWIRVSKVRPFINWYIGIGMFFAVSVVAMLFIQSWLLMLVGGIFAYIFLSTGFDKLKRSQDIYDKYKNDQEKYRKAIIRDQDMEKAQNEMINTYRKNSKNKHNAGIKCPMCGSGNVYRISTTNRAVSVATVGLASSKIGKQYECKNCKHKW